MSIRLVAPAFAWAEVGSLLRKKTRMGVITIEQAQGFFQDFNELPIDYIQEEAIRARTWEIAEIYGLPTLYDAAFLACTESISGEFWTSNRSRMLYLRKIAEVNKSFHHLRCGKCL